MRLLAALCCAALLAGCAYPTSVVEQGSQPSTLYFPAAPTDAIVVVDGVEMGPAAGYDGKKASLKVASGKHHVVVRGAGRSAYDAVIYLDEGAHMAIKAH